MSLNKVMLIGNVGNDPEIRYLDNQNPGGNARVARFRLATTERFRDRNNELRENTEWHSIAAWRNNAEIVEKFVHKGSQVYIEGRLRNRQWQDQTGATRYTTEIEATNIQLLGKRPDVPQQGGAPAAQPQVSQPQQYQQPAAPVPPAAPAAGPEDDLPF
ncbi:MAG: single-stranded DNA-binding protein [Bacteroidales bacterium]|nr:single-stranded DNA-binding protein [Bacteroidales bacterium]